MLRLFVVDNGLIKVIRSSENNDGGFFVSLDEAGKAALKRAAFQPESFYIVIDMDTGKYVQHWRM